MNVREATLNAASDAIDSESVWRAKGFLEAVEKMKPLVEALEVLSSGSCERKGCSAVADVVLEIYRTEVLVEKE